MLQWISMKQISFFVCFIENIKSFLGSTKILSVYDDSD